MMGLANLLIGGVLAAIIKSRPQLKKIANDREANLLTERAGDLKDMNKRILDLEAKVDRANEAASIAKDATAVVQMQMVSMQAAFELVAGELARADPNNPTLKQARQLIAQAATRDMGVGVAMQKLAAIRGTGE